MDGLLQVEEYLISEHISFERDKSILVVDTQPGIDAMITICEKGKDDLAIQVSTQVDLAIVSRINELVRVLEKKLNGRKCDREALFEAGFEPDEMCLWVTNVFHESDIEDEIETFLGFVSHCFLPLVAHIEKTGGWSEQVLLVTLMNPFADGATGFS